MGGGWRRVVAEGLTSTAGGWGKYLCFNPQALSPQGKGHREAREEVGERAGGQGVGSITQVSWLPVSQSPQLSR